MYYGLVNQAGQYFNGRAGAENWLTSDRSEAFEYSGECAKVKAAQFNTFSSVHGQYFSVVPL